MRKSPKKPHLSSVPEALRRAGDIEPFLTGRKTYLAPLPLPTDAHPYCPYISDINDVYLDFGGMRPAKSSTQPRNAKTWCALKFKWAPVLTF